MAKIKMVNEERLKAMLATELESAWLSLADQQRLRLSLDLSRPGKGSFQESWLIDGKEQDNIIRRHRQYRLSSLLVSATAIVALLSLCLWWLLFTATGREKGECHASKDLIKASPSPKGPTAER